MFLFGTDNTTLRAWPIHAIISVMFKPADGSRKAELAIYLTDGTTVWLRDAEAKATWGKIVESGIGLAESARPKD